MPFKIFLLFICVQLSFAQNSESEIRGVIQTAKDTALIKAYQDLGNYYYYNSGKGDSLIKYGKKALKLSQDLKNTQKEILAYMYLASAYNIYANAHINSDSYKKAEENLNIALSIAIYAKDVKRQAEIHNKFGAIFLNQGKKLLAIEHRLKAVKLSKTISDYTNTALAYYGISFVYAHDEQEDKALEYINKAIQILENETGISKKAKFVIYKFASQLYLNLFSEFKNENYGDLALLYTNRALDIAKQNNFESLIPVGLSFLSDYYLEIKDYKKASLYAKEALNYNKFLSEPIKINIFETLSSVSRENNQKVFAYVYLDSLNNLKIKSEPYYGAAITNFSYETYIFFKDYELAFKAIEEKLQFEKELKEQEQIKAINELETKYQTDLKNSEIKSLSQQQRINTLEIENKQVQIKRLIFLLILSSLIIIGILFIATRIQLKRTKQKNEALKIAFDKQVALEKELTGVRDNIAQDFHDDLGNRLARISLLSNLVNNEVSKKDEKLRSKVKQITDDANDLYLGTRDFIFSLKENSDYIEELATYLSDFGENYFSKTNNKFALEKHIETNVKLPYYWNKQLIYIFKEAMTNALKHAKCNQVTLKFNYSKNNLKIECIDDGIGINAESLNSTNGLLNMKERANKIGGNLQIESKESQGTKICFSGKTV
ncbi:MAG: ATP-binding protein [Flavobacteriaceae bacterium]